MINDFGNDDLFDSDFNIPLALDSLTVISLLVIKDFIHTLGNKHNATAIIVSDLLTG